MGLLLMQFEYQRARQKYSTYQRIGIRLNDQQETYTKRVSQIETLFGKKKTSIESKWSRLISEANSAISGAQTSAITLFGVIGNLNSTYGMNIDTGYSTDGDFNNAVGSCASKRVSASTDEVNVSTSTQNQTAAVLSSVAAQVKAIVQETLDALKEQELADLEAAEDAQLEPIQMKDTEVELKVAENDTLMELTKARMDSAKSRLGEVVKDSVAHYGISG